MKDFVKTLKSRGVRHNALPKGSPNLNGRCERFVKTIREECLSKFILFGTNHLDFIVAEFCDYYNKTRSHSERESLPPIRTVPDEVCSVKLSDIEVKSHVGGLVRSFVRRAA